MSYYRLDCKLQRILHRSFLKYGVHKHKFEILCECEVSELNEKERYYQDLYCVLGKGGLNCILTNASDRKGEHSQSTKLKIGIANKGKFFSEEHKAKLSIARKNISDETRIKMSNSQKGRKTTEETKAKLSAAGKGNKYNLGKKLSEEHKNKISTAGKGKKRSKETIAKIIESKKGKKHSEETKLKLRLINLGKKHSEETKAKLRKARKRKTIKKN